MSNNLRGCNFITLECPKRLFQNLSGNDTTLLYERLHKRNETSMKKKKKRIITLLCIGLTIGAIVWVASVAHEIKSMVTDLDIDYYGDHYKTK